MQFNNEKITSEGLHFGPSDLVQIVRKLTEIEQERGLYTTTRDSLARQRSQLRQMEQSARTVLKLSDNEERRQWALNTLAFVSREMPVLESMDKLYQVADYSLEQARNWWAYKAETLCANEIYHDLQALEAREKTPCIPDECNECANAEHPWKKECIECANAEWRKENPSFEECTVTVVEDSGL